MTQHDLVYCFLLVGGGMLAKDWWALGLTMAIAVPILFELALGLAFRLQVHE